MVQAALQISRHCFHADTPNIRILCQPPFFVVCLGAIPGGGPSSAQRVVPGITTRPPLCSQEHGYPGALGSSWGAQSRELEAEKDSSCVSPSSIPVSLSSQDRALGSPLPPLFVHSHGRGIS